MRKVFVIALTFVAAALGMPAGILAAGPRGQQIVPATTGGIQGVARNARQELLPGAQVQARALNGELVAVGTTNSGGAFSFPGLNPGVYTVELIDAAGNIVGTSVSITVGAGLVATGNVTAAASGAIAAAGGGGVKLFGLGGVATVAVLGAAAGGLAIAVVATQKDASPSR
jgi:hypothetical protein